LITADKFHVPGGPIQSPKKRRYITESGDGQKKSRDDPGRLTPPHKLTACLLFKKISVLIIDVLRFAVKEIVIHDKQ